MARQDRCGWLGCGTVSATLNGLRSATAWQYFNDICQHSPSAVAKFIAATKENLPAGGPEQFCQSLIYGNPEKTSWMARVGDFVALQDSAKRDTSLKHKGLRFLGKQIEMNSDRAKFYRLAVATAIQNGSTHEVIANTSTRMDIKINLTLMVIFQSRGHVDVMREEGALHVWKFLRRHKRHPRPCTADAIKKHQWCQIVLAGGLGFLRIKCTLHTDGVAAGRIRDKCDQLVADPHG